MRRVPLVALMAALTTAAIAQEPSGERRVFLKPREAKKDVPYVPTPPAVVQAMIEMAAVKKGDVVYDLGCGDGRIVIAAVKTPGVRGVCVDIDPDRIAESRVNARTAGVENRITFVRGDLFQTPIADATVVMMYLLPEVNMRLRPRLRGELRPGTRIVSHAFSMGEWTPTRSIEVGEPPDSAPVYLWVIPPRKGRSPS